MVTTHSSETSKPTHYTVHCKNPQDRNLRFNGINETVQLTSHFEGTIRQTVAVSGDVDPAIWVLLLMF